MALFKPRKQSASDGQMDLMEHLTELRARIIRAVIYILVGMVLTYNLFNLLYTLLTFPLAQIIGAQGTLHGTLAFSGIQTAFLIRMQVAFISGIALAFPLIILELWGFIEPALTIEERKPVKYLAPFSVLLFIAGIGMGYACLPATFAWMAKYASDLPGVQLILDTQMYIVLTVKIILAFGISFQLPMVLLFLARIGLITADLMTTYWRHATVGIAFLAAVLTPSNDPFTMLMMAVPMVGLYLLSIGLVRAFEPKADGTRTPAIFTMMVVALAPIGLILAVGYWMIRTTHHTDLSARPASTIAGPADTQQTKALQAQIDALSKRIQFLETKNGAR